MESTAIYPKTTIQEGIMPRGFKLRVVECKRCGYKWVPRVKRPTVCPHCGSPYWDKAVKYPKRGRKRKK